MFKETLFRIVANFITEALVTLLNIFKGNNTQEKYDRVKGLIKEAFELLEEDVKRTKTKADDTLVKIVLDAVEKAD